jgi:hypothetical protein
MSLSLSNIITMLLIIALIQVIAIGLKFCYFLKTIMTNLLLFILFSSLFNFYFRIS